MLTIIPVSYVDGLGRRTHHHIIAPGELDPGTRARLARTLVGPRGNGFIPEQVGLPHIAAGQLTMAGFPDPAIDHPWHELDLIEARTVPHDAPVPVGLWAAGLADLLREFEAAAQAGWAPESFHPCTGQPNPVSTGTVRQRNLHLVLGVTRESGRPVPAGQPG